MATKTMLYPDSQGRIELGSLIQQLKDQLGSHISGFSAELTDDGAIILQPCLAMAAAEPNTLVLQNTDRDQFVTALEAIVPKPNAALRKAQQNHRKTVLRQQPR